MRHLQRCFHNPPGSTAQQDSFRCHWQKCSQQGSTFLRDMANSFRLSLYPQQRNCRRGKGLFRRRCCNPPGKTCRQGMANTMPSPSMQMFQVGISSKKPLRLAHLLHKILRGNLPSVRMTSSIDSIFRPGKANRTQRFLVLNQSMYQLCKFQHPNV